MRNGGNTDWTLEQVKDEILERMNTLDTPEDEYSDDELIEDFEELIISSQKCEEAKK